VERSRRWEQRVLPWLITCAAVAVAAVLGMAMWRRYVEAPWTRDGTVRADVVTMAPEIAGRIVELRVADNQYVHKGELLMVIDPTDYQIAVSRGTAVLAAGETGRPKPAARIRASRSIGQAGRGRSGAGH
jgi:multidrug resistance efflux pump